MQLNPGRGVPALVLADGTVLTQSLAILEYLDTLAEPRLIPQEPLQRARVQAAAQVIAAEVHPVNNMRVMKHLAKLGLDAQQQVAWQHEWMRRGFDSYLGLIDATGAYSFGDDPTIADLCLMGQVLSARRWGFDLAPYPRVLEIEARCLTVPALVQALPAHQPDAQNEG